MSSALLVDYTQFDPSKLIFLNPDRKQIPAGAAVPVQGAPGQQGQQGHYHDIKIKYNYGTAERPLVDDLFLEGPLLTSGSGILSKLEANGRTSYSVMAFLPGDNPEVVAFINQLDLLYRAGAKAVYDQRGTLKMPHFDINNPQSGFRNPVYTPIDEVTNEPIPGRSKSMYFKCYTRGKEPTVERSLFTDLNENPIHWGILSAVEMSFVPLVHVEKIYVGAGKASLQLKLKSSVVKSVSARNTTTSQTGTIARLKEQDPNAALLLDQQVAKLTQMRQDHLGEPVMAADHEPTFAGMDAPAPNSTYSVPALPAIPTLPALTASTMELQPQHSYIAPTPIPNAIPSSYPVPTPGNDYRPAPVGNEYRAPTTIQRPYRTGFGASIS